MERYLLAPVIAIFIVALIMVNPIAATAATATQYNVTIMVVGADKSPLSNATVTLYDVYGNKYEGTTDSRGQAVIAVPANGTYLVVVKAEYYILGTVSVTGDTSYTVDASTMTYANITSTPISVDVKVVLGSFNTVGLTMTTNITVYAPSTINVTFPSEISKFPYKYVFSKVEYNGIESNDTTISLDMTSNYAVTAYYTKSFFVEMNYWIIALIVIIIIAALAIAWSAGTRAAKTMIEEWREENRKFVKRKEE